MRVNRKKTFSLAGILTIAALLAILAGYLLFDRNIRWAFGELDGPLKPPPSGDSTPATSAVVAATSELPTETAPPTPFDRLISPGGWGLGWQTFAAPLAIGHDVLMLFEQDDRRAVVWRIDWPSRSAQSFDVPSLPLGRERYAAVAGKEGVWLVGPHLALIRPTGEAIVRNFGADEPAAFALPDGGVLALVEGANNAPARVSHLSLGAMDDLRVEDRGPLPHGRHSGYAATVLADGRLMVAGGDGAPTAVDIYDPKNDRWQPADPLPVGRVGAVALALPDGRAVIAGAGSSSAEGAHQVSVWDPQSDLWQALPDLPWSLRVASRGHLMASGAVLPDGGLVFGGAMDNAVQVLAKHGKDWAPRWSVVSSGSFQRVGGIVQALGNNRVAIAGGIFDRPGAADCCTQAGVDQVALGENPVVVREILGLTRDRPVLALQGRELLVAGGEKTFEMGVGAQQFSALVEQVDLASGSVRQTAPLPVPIGHGRAEWLDRDRLVVKGAGRSTAEPQRGMDERTPEVQDTGDVLAVYDRRRDAWQSLADPRLRAAELAGIVGGEAILFDANGRGWAVSLANFALREFPRLTLARSNGVGRVLPDGRIVVAGGEAASTLVSVIDPDCDGEDCPERYVGFGEKSTATRHEIYSPGTRSWRLSVGSEIVPLGTAILGDGSVVHAGRSNADGARLRIRRSSADGQSWSDLPLPVELTASGRHEGAPCTSDEGINSCRLALGRSPDDGGDLLFVKQLDQSDRHWLWDDGRQVWLLLDGLSGVEPLPWIEVARPNGRRWRVGGLDSGRAMVWSAG